MVTPITVVDYKMNKYAAHITLLPLVTFLVAEFTFALVAAEPPKASYAMAYTSVGEAALYIQGGTTDGGQSGVNQFSSLNLTQKTWDTSSPPWQSLSVGTGAQSSPNAWEHSMTLSKDKNNLVVYDSTPSAPGISVFNLVSGTWLAKRALPSNPMASDYYGLRSAVDPNTGIIYIPTGTKDNQTLAYDFESGISSLFPNPSASIMNPIVTLYSIVWSAARNSLLLYGGRGITPNGIVPNPFFAELAPGPAAIWRTLATTGHYPGAVERHCMVPAYGGSKMILFGGCTISRRSLGSIYILDMKTLSWMKGPDVDPSQNRSRMACAVAGDNFVAWGGEQFETSIVNLASTLVFNLRTNEWTNQFSLLEAPLSAGTGGEPPKPSGSNSNSGPSFSGNPESDGTDWTGIGGGIAGAVVVAVMVALFLFKRHKNARAKNRNNTLPPYSPPTLQHETPEWRGFGTMTSASEQNQTQKEETMISRHHAVLEAPGSTTGSSHYRSHGGNNPQALYSAAYNTDSAPNGDDRNMQIQSSEYRRAPHAYKPQEPVASGPQKVLSNPQYTSPPAQESSQ
ncbi:hypothetical protein BGZ72_005047 [Mortierella alpina]|nr:hypothetical protein BGZ72_005047 [Mortierella alpina]